MKRVLFVALALLYTAFAVAAEPQQSQVYPTKDHPRLFMDNALLQSVTTAVERDPYWKGVDAYILEQSALALKLPLPEHKVIGRRLLGTSREVLCRVVYLSYTYRTTGNTLFAERAETEMLTAAAFEDWNPSHFLDVAEMTAALAIGYDWLYDYLSDEAREIIATAIEEKGLRTSLIEKNYRQWVESKNNWNQVCHTGLVIGAIATQERDAELSAQIIDRALEKVTNSMSNYEPMGAYAEGPGYWEYGTLFNALLIDALDTAYGSNYGLVENHAGFQKTSDYITHMITPCGNQYNYGDNSLRPSYNIAPFWFAKKFGVEEILTPIFNIDLARQRLLPLSIIWGHKFSPSEPKLPAENFWDAPNPVESRLWPRALNR